MQSFRLIGNAR